MSRILIPSTGAASWQALLAEPERQWATGFSARTLAYAWEVADGFPPEIDGILTQALGPVKLLIALPEHKTPLPGGSRESQSDVFALGRHARGLVACAVEGKVNEPFGPTVGEWMRDASPGKHERLAHILGLLGISDCPPEVHYQLLHRTASALIEAERFCADSAAMLVHSFSAERRWFDAFLRFAALLGTQAEVGTACAVPVPSGKRLVLGWACGDQRFLSM